MNLIYSLVFLLVIHYIADFLCQTREMATNKSTSLKWLTYHVLTYTMVLAFSMSAFMFFTAENAGETIMTVWVFTIVNGVLHWCTDFVTSKGTTHFYKQENWYGFFGLLGLDQLIHTVTLLLTYNYFLN